MVILETNDLSKTYGYGENTVAALKKCNLSVSQGEFVTIMGPSGSGKSTLLHLLGGLEDPTAGTVKIEGQDLFSLNDNDLSIYRRRKIGFVFQNYNLIPVISVKENIGFPILLDKGRVDSRQVDEICESLGIADKMKYYPYELSGGQQQRVAIARALINQPAIILADEPTGNLDTQTSNEVISLLKATIKKYNQTLIMITHNQELAKSADRVVSIIDGQLYS